MYKPDATLGLKTLRCSPDREMPVSRRISNEQSIFYCKFLICLGIYRPVQGSEVNFATSLIGEYRFFFPLESAYLFYNQKNFFFQHMSLNIGPSWAVKPADSSQGSVSQFSVHYCSSFFHFCVCLVTRHALLLTFFPFPCFLVPSLPL